jgi:hypothetical protein
MRNRVHLRPDLPATLGPIRFSWDHPGTKTPSFLALFGMISGVRTIESSRVLERAMGIEQIRMNQTKVLPPAFQFNWSQMESNSNIRYRNQLIRFTRVYGILQRLASWTR